MLVAQTMIKKIALPLNAMFYGREFFPVSNGHCHARFAWESDDGVQMIRHQQAQPAMPDEFFVIMRHRCQDSIANASLAKLVSAGRNAFDGDEKPAAVRNPLWHGVWNFFADGQIHAIGLTPRREREKPKVGRAVLCAPLGRMPATDGAQGTARLPNWDARWRALPSQPVQHVNQLPQAAVIAAVEAEGDSRQVQVVLVFDFLRRRFDVFDGRAVNDVCEVLVDGSEGGF
jgi:hypothetical protein